jgi:hypothetical protein
VGFILAEDGDAGVNGEVDYSILSATNDGKWLRLHQLTNYSDYSVTFNPLIYLYMFLRLCNQFRSSDLDLYLSHLGQK